MKFVEWCGLFVIGDKVIDEQHSKLFNIANDFTDAVSNGQTDNKTAFQVLNALIDYAQNHFTTEEEAARRLGFPPEELEALSESHEKLIEEIFDLHGRLSKAEGFNVKEVEDFLAQWLIMHVLVEDRKIKPFVDSSAHP